MRAATEDRDMAAALGINQALLFTSVFALGSFLAGLGGALALPREPANLSMDLSIIADVFVVTVVGGLGSIPGRLCRRSHHQRRQGLVHRHGRCHVLGRGASRSPS